MHDLDSSGCAYSRAFPSGNSIINVLPLRYKCTGIPASRLNERTATIGIFTKLDPLVYWISRVPKSIIISTIRIVGRISYIYFWLDRSITTSLMGVVLCRVIPTFQLETSKGVVRRLVFLLTHS